MGIILCLSHHFMTDVGGHVSSVSYAFRLKETLLKKVYPKRHVCPCADVSERFWVAADTAKGLAMLLEGWQELGAREATEEAVDRTQRGSRRR